MLWDFSFLFLSPSLLLTSLKESFKPTNKKNIYFGRAGKGGGQGNYLGGKGQYGAWGGGRRELIKSKGTFASCLFPPSGVCKLFFLCEWVCACETHLGVCVDVGVDVCVQACFLGKGAGEGGFVMSFVEREHRWHLTGNVLGGIAGFCLLIATLRTWSPSLY